MFLLEFDAHLTRFEWTKVPISLYIDICVHRPRYCRKIFQVPIACTGPLVSCPTIWSLYWYLGFCNDGQILPLWAHLYFTSSYRGSPPCTLSQHPDNRETWYSNVLQQLVTSLQSNRFNLRDSHLLLVFNLFLNKMWLEGCTVTG